MATDRFGRRTFLTSVGSTAVALSVTGCTSLPGGGDGDGDGGAREVTPGTAPGFPPFEMIRDGKLVGFDIDLLEAVIAETRFDLADWKTFEFGSLTPALTSDKIDVIAAAMTITDERDETIDFSDPYYSVDQAILVRAGGDFSPEELSDLSGHKVGAQKGTTGENVVKDQLIATGKLKEGNYNAYDNYVLAVEDLQNGNIDAVVVDKPVAATFAEERPVTVAFVYETGETYGFGVRTEDDDLTEAINGGLVTVQEDGTYADIRNKWFGSGQGDGTNPY